MNHVSFKRIFRVEHIFRVDRKMSLGIFLGIIAILCYMSQNYFVKLIYTEQQHFEAISAHMIQLMRAFVAFFLCLIIALLSKKELPFISLRKKQQNPISNRSIWVLAGLSASFYASNLIAFIALKEINVGVSRAIVAVFPVFVVFITALITWKKPSASIWGALCVTQLGVFLITKYYGLGGSDISVTGTLYMLTAALLYATSVTLMGTRALSAITSKIAKNHYIMLFFLLWSFTLPFLFTCNWTEQLAHIVDLEVMTYVYAGLMGTISTVIPYFLAFKSISLINHQNYAFLGSNVPFFALAIDSVFLGIHVSLLQWCGTILVVGTCYWMALRK